MLLVAIPASLWLQRRPIAADALDRELARRGVQATYRVVQVGPSLQRLEDIVIGDPRRPDLTAKWAEILVTTRWSILRPTQPGVTVRKISATGVRLRGQLVGGKLRLGQIDRLLPPPSGKPFAFPGFEVDLADTQIRLATPAGLVGLAVEGRGKLSDGFRGRLAASAPRFAAGPCTATGVRARFALAIDARSPHVVGPLSASQVSCPRSAVRVVRPNLLLDARVPESFDGWRGTAALDVVTADVARGTFAGVRGRVGFSGNADVTLGGLALNTGTARFAGHAGRALRFDGRYRVQPRAGRVGLLGDVGLRDLELAPALRASLVRPLDAIARTPLAPLGQAASVALIRALRSIEVTGQLRLVHGPAGGGARMTAMRAGSDSGARLGIAGGEGLSYYWPAGVLRIDGEAALGGGGLPTARLAFDQPRPGAPVSGVLRVAPYAAGGTRLALVPVRFRSAGGRRTRIDTVATLDGAWRGGRVEGLVLPIAGHVGPGGAYTFNEACFSARWRSLRYGNLLLGPTALPLCPDGPLVRNGGKGFADSATIDRPRFAGRFNGRPFSAAASRSRVSLGKSAVRADDLRVDWGVIGATARTFDARIAGRRFAAGGVALRIGEEPSQTKVDLESVNGGWQGSDFAGTFGSQGRARIGQVPLLLSGAVGRWSYRRNVLDIRGGLVVADADPNPRFYPLNADDARLTLRDNRIVASAFLKDPETGTKVSDVTIAHDLRDGTGNAVLNVPGITFGPRFQPEALTRLTTGVVALVDGTVRGRGNVRWNRMGVTSDGRFRTDDLDLAAAFGPVSGLKGEIVFSDLLGLTTAPGQSVDIAQIEAGILVADGRVRYQLLPGQRVRVEQGRWPYAGGELILEETVLELGRPAPKKLVFRVVGMDAAQFVQQFGFENIATTGIFDGTIPMVFDESGGRIVGGALTSRADGGTLAYVGVLSDQALGTYGKLAFDALKSLRYSGMSVFLDGDLDGEFLSRFTIAGRNQNEKATGILKQITGLPFKFNIAIRGQFRALLATARSFNDPRELIRQSQPLSIERVPGTAPAIIQPPSSEKRP